jgi:hypothetical protein
MGERRMQTFADAITSTNLSTPDALELFDSLNPVQIDFMLGSWKGEGVPTKHPLDGFLETYHWYGKTFESAEHVHPLVFRRASGSRCRVNPVFLIPTLWLIDRRALPKTRTVARIFQALLPLLVTGHSCARLRLTSYRGRESATMIYDSLPINDVFRMVDEDTVMGVMDRKGEEQPFFFMLRRERQA